VPLRLLHVSQPVEAGVPAVVTALATDQVARGHEVHVACPPAAALVERITRLGAAHHAWPAERSPGAAVAGETRRLRRIVDAVDPDVVILHSAKAGLAGRLAVRGRRPTVYVPHAWSFEAVRGPVGAAATAWEVLAARWTDVTVCVSADERDRGRAVGIPGAMAVVPNGVDVRTFVPAPAADARERLGLPHAPTVTCIGRLAEQKGQDLLLAAWPAVRAAVPRAQLVLVGDGPKRAALTAAAPEGVLFTGARTDVPDFLTAADVVALPSRWESTPLVSLEAMASGRPVVAFEVDGVRAAFGDTGVVLEQGDVAGLAAALARFLRRPDEAATAGRAARERAEAVADLRRSLAAWDDVVTAVAERRAGGLRVVPAGSLSAFLLGGGGASADVAVVDGIRRGDAARAAALSALGVPVHWRGVPTRAPRALGAPVVTSAAALDRAVRRPGAGADGGPPVSVVITVLNEGPALAGVVSDVLAQLGPEDELVLVDGGSTDGSLNGLPRSPRLQVEVVPGAGISAGRNHGVRLARNDVIVVTDAGCTLEPGFVDGFRRAFAGEAPPALVSGVYRVLARGALEQAQALACYPQPGEVRRPGLFVRAYTALFGTGFDPRFAVGRCVAFTREAWKAVDGFPEHLATGEDVSFGLAVARHGRVEATTDAVVGWTQRDGLAATWRMYRGYGRASTDGGDRALLVRDGVRGLAYLVAPVLAARPGTRPLLAAGAAAYLSLPLVRALKAGAGPATVALLPVALGVKDLGKLAGAVQGLLRRRPW
jgi:glycosyltransferase involved in cell wall biosynthesis